MIDYDKLPIWVFLNLQESKDTLIKEIEAIDALMNCQHELDRKFINSMQSEVKCKKCGIEYTL